MRIWRGDCKTLRCVKSPFWAVLQSHLLACPIGQAAVDALGRALSVLCKTAQNHRFSAVVKFCNRLWILLIFLFTSCSPSNLQELRYEGEGEIKKFVQDLRKMETKEDVQRSFKKLKNHFNRIADLIILGEDKNFFRSVREVDEHLEDSSSGDALFIELARVYEIPGAREIVEKAQEEAVHRLDRFREHAP